jgi:uncharacterized protein
VKKIILRWLKVFIIVYCLIGIGLYYAQDLFLFRPVAMQKEASYDFTQPHRDVFLSLDNSTQLHVVQFTRPDSSLPARGVVLYFHGNRKNIGWYAKYASYFTRNNYEVWMIDYPGFGKSTGKVTEAILYESAQQLYKLARAKYPADSVVLYGKSMGTGIAAYLASKRDCRQLILETPYYSIPSLVAQFAPVYPVNLMIHYKFPTWKYVQEVTAPITILHGTADGIIRYSNASKLKPYLKKEDRFITIPGGSHNDLSDFPLFQQQLDSLLKR